MLQVLLLRHSSTTRSLISDISSFTNTLFMCSEGRKAVSYVGRQVSKPITGMLQISFFYFRVRAFHLLIAAKMSSDFPQI